MSYMETYKEWCTNPYFDENTKAELAAIGDDAAEIEDRFYRQLEFGTGGLREMCIRDRLTVDSILLIDSSIFENLYSVSFFSL